MPNAELMLSALDHIKTHPEEWRQEVWYVPADGGDPVQACYGVRALLLSGVRLRKSALRVLVLADSLPEQIRERCVQDSHPGLAPLYAAPAVCAREILGLATQQAAKLFDADQGLEDLEAEVAQILASGVDEFTERQTETESIPF